MLKEVSVEESVGRVVSAIETDSYTGLMVVKFADDTFLLFCAVEENYNIKVPVIPASMDSLVKDYGFDAYDLSHTNIGTREEIEEELARRPERHYIRRPAKS